MRRETQNVLLVLLGGAVLKIALNGQYLRYVKPGLQPWLIAAGVATVLLAVVGIARDIQAASARANGVPAAGGDDHGHAHSSRSPWLLLLPVLAIFLVAPPALGADKVSRSGDRTAVGAAPSDSSFKQLPDEDAPLLSIGDAVTRAVWDSSGTLDGRQIRLVGFVVRKPGGGIDLARLVISCCAADAAPVKVRLEGDGLDGFESDTWLQVRGEVLARTATEENGYVPTFRVTSLTEVPAPADPYES